MFSSDNPYAEMGELRRQGAVIPYAARGGTDSYFVTRHEEAAAVLRDASTYSTSFVSDALGSLVGDTPLVGLEGDRHRIHRQLLAGALATSSSRTRHEAALRRISDEYVGAIARERSGDLIADLALPLPGRVMAVILGLPEAGSLRLQQWSVQLLRNARAGTPDDSLQGALGEHLMPAIEQARTCPMDDVIGHLVRADIGGQPLSDEAVCALVGFLLVAGLETFHRAIGNMLFALLTHPDQLEAVRGDRSLRNAAIEEALRWESPVTLTVRNTVVDSALAGTESCAGSLMYVLLGSANRDERRHVDPDRFDIFRDLKPHLTFGRGPHVCPGASLSRVALAILLDRVLDTTTHIELDSSEEPPAVHGEIFRSPEALAVLCRSAHSA